MFGVFVFFVFFLLFSYFLRCCSLMSRASPLAKDWKWGLTRNEASGDALLGFYAVLVRFVKSLFKSFCGVVLKRF